MYKCRLSCSIHGPLSPWCGPRMREMERKGENYREKKERTKHPQVPEHRGTHVHMHIHVKMPRSKNH
jgi:hypothetical protein